MLNTGVLKFLRWKIAYPSASVACLFLMFVSMQSQGQALEEFSPSKVILQDEGMVEDYRLILSSLKKINGQWQTARELRLAGHLQRTTLELVGGHTVEEGYAFYLKQLNEVQGSREIFSCEGLKCGPSSSWANIRFQQKELYGLDKYQHYSVWALADHEFLSLYAIRRGNKRVYLHLEVLTSEQENSVNIATAPETIVRMLNREGAYTLFPATYATEEVNSHMVSLTKALQSNRLMKVTLQSFDHRADEGESLSEGVSAKLEWLKGVLVKGGIRETRLTLDSASNPKSNSDFGIRVIKTPRR